MIDRTIQLALIGGLASIVLGAVLEFGHHERNVGRKEVRDQMAAEAGKRQTVALTKTTAVLAGNAAKDAKAEKVNDETQAKHAAVAADAGRAADAHRSLLDTLDRVRADAMREATAHSRLAAEITATADSLGECSGRYSTVAGERDGLAVQVSGLLALTPNAPTAP